MKVTKKHKLETWDAIDRDLTRYRRAFGAAMRSEVATVSATPTVNGRKYTMSVISPLQSDGGYLVVRFHANTGQLDTFDVYPLDDKLAELTRSSPYARDKERMEVCLCVERVQQRVREWRAAHYGRNGADRL